MSEITLRRQRPIAWIVATTFCLVLAVGALVRSGGWDQSYYLAQVSSVLEDRDLDLRNDLLHLHNDPIETRRMLGSTRPDGTLLNTFTVGPVLFWSPAYLAGLAVRGLIARSAELAPPRWTEVQFAALHLLSLLLSLYIFWFLERWLRRAGAVPGQVRLATLALVIGSPLLIYGFVSYTMTHLLSAAAACWFLAAVLDFDRQPTLARSVTCGASLGLVFLARWQGVSIALALLLPFARLLRAKMPWRQVLAFAAGITAAGVLVVSLQLRAWHLELGHWLTLPQGAGYMHWTHPEWFRFLFSGVSGMFVWSPLLAVGGVGLLLPWRLRLSPGWRWVAIAAMFFDVYLNAAVSDWWGGESYGARRMSADLPWVALGVANLTRGLPGRWLQRGLAACLVLLCGYGFFTANAFSRGVQDLAFVFTGSSSDAPGAERETAAIRDPQAARRLALTLPLHLTRADYFAASPESPTHAGRAATLVIVLATLIVGALCLRRTRPARALQALMGVAMAGVVLLQLWLSFGEPPDAAERLRWQAWVQRVDELRGDDGRGGVPAALVGDSSTSRLDPYRYVGAFLDYADGEGARARNTFASLAEKGYPPAQAMDRRGLRDDRGTLVRWLAGPFLEPKRGRMARRFALPKSRGSLRIEFGLRLGKLAPQRKYPVIMLLDGIGPLVSAGVDGEGGLWLRADDEPPARIPGVVADTRYAFALTWDPASGVADLSAEGPANHHLGLHATTRPSADLDGATLRFGRAPGKAEGDALWGATFEDLSVVAVTIPGP